MLMPFGINLNMLVKANYHEIASKMVPESMTYNERPKNDIQLRYLQDTLFACSNNHLPTRFHNIIAHKIWFTNRVVKIN